ncbi:hypothetical protein N7513_009652 [Penicillium frequentans]|nr:hypothetical protein N7513_009652 [Penicillium glabrum]
MSHQDSKRNGAQEEDRRAEARLLGSGSRIKDKNAVKIKPGASMLNRNKNPWLKCGVSSVRRNIQQLTREWTNAFEPSNRPNKRRRQDGISEIFDKGVNDPLSPPTNSLSRLSPESSQLSTKSKNHALPFRQGEYREVENSVRVSHKSPRARRQQNRQTSTSTQSPDEKFTAQATEQRRSKAGIMESPTAKSGTKGLAPSVLDAVEVPVVKEEKTTAQTKPTQSVSAKRNGLKRRSDSESPDELQGEVTTQPIPTDINERQTQARLSTKEHSVSPDRGSPTDIVPTNFIGSKKKAKRKNNSSDATRLRLNIIHLQCGCEGTKSYVNDSKTTIYINHDHQKIEIEDDILGAGAPVSIEFRKVVRIIHGKDPSAKLCLFLSKGASPLGENVDMEFSNCQMKTQFIDSLNLKPIVTLEKKPEFMDKVFANHKHAFDRAFQNHKLEAQKHQYPKRPLPDLDSTSAPPARSSTRQKISSSLQGSVDEPGSKRMKHNFSSIAKTGDGTTETRAQESGGKLDPNAGVEIPVKKSYGTQAPSDRETRSTRRTYADDSVDSHHSHFTKTLLQAKDENREKWKKPMVYPRVGKKRAEVSVEDRDRLREDEFLNDNLIGFYLRFLEDHLQRTNKDVAERTYFFNSYFFATLKKGRGIDYSAVEKWTRNIDLFSYDYVVVPINQDVHWYVAIICNLPSLDLASAGPVDQSSAPVSDKEVSAQPESEVHEIPESPEPEPVSAATTTTTDAQEACKSMTSATIGEEGTSAATEEVDTSTPGSKEKMQDDSSPGSWPDGAENIASPPPKVPRMRWDRTDPTTAANHSSPKTNKKGEPGLKLQPSPPIIITFDSLDMPRSPTIKHLRDYICLEAASKRGVEVDPKEIKGMRARQIPLQPNFSDCGLYLLAYIEKFVQDPDNFITRVLQRDMDAHADWPPLGSGMLRIRLRKFLDDMYEEQKKQDSHSVMADQQRISFLLGQEDDEEDKEEERQPTSPDRPENSKTVQEDH